MKMSDKLYHFSKVIQRLSSLGEISINFRTAKYFSWKDIEEDLSYAIELIMEIEKDVTYQELKRGIEQIDNSLEEEEAR